MPIKMSQVPSFILRSGHSKEMQQGHRLATAENCTHSDKSDLWGSASSPVFSLSHCCLQKETAPLSQHSTRVNKRQDHEEPQLFQKRNTFRLWHKDRRSIWIQMRFKRPDFPSTAHVQPQEDEEKGFPAGPGFSALAPAGQKPLPQPPGLGTPISKS